MLASRSVLGDSTHAAALPSPLNMFRTGRDIYFACDITITSCHQLIRLLKEAEVDALEEVQRACSDKLDVVKRYPNLTISMEPKPITLHITTYGGIIHSAFSVVDAMTNLKVPVHTVVSGYTASAGSLISIAGTKRFITANSYMMIHELRGGFWGRYGEVREQGLNLTKLMAHIVAFYESRSNGKLTGDTLTNILARDTDWDASECVANGLADEVIQCVQP